ncbi:MAG: hypothetical protein WC028_25585 [Candidatus Obscuribacterales bacterium]
MSITFTIIGLIMIAVAFPLSKLEKTGGSFGGFGPGVTIKYGRLLALIACIGGAALILKGAGAF